MKSFVIIIKLVFLILYLNCYHQANGDASYVRDSITKSQAVLASSKDVFSNINLIIKSANPGKIFTKISGVLGALGPAAMGISAALSIVTIFLPQEDSPELKAIKAGFEQVNNKIDIITSKIGNLDNIIELSSARAAYVKTVSTINNNFEALQDAQTSQTNNSYQLFIEQYERTFEFATANMYDVMTGSTGAFGFNMVNLYKTHVKCNPVLVSQFCTLGMHLINKGLAVEGAYLGYRNFSEKAQSKEETWKEKLNDVSKQCSAIIETCQNSWKEYASQQFEDSHRQISGSNQQFADKLAKDLDAVVPQRNWLAVVYGAASGFGPHTYSSYYPAETKWRVRDHDVTIFSVEKREPLAKDEYDNLVKIVNQQKDQAARIGNCKKEAFWVILKDRYDDDARIIVNKIREKYMTGVVYAIQNNFQPGFAITGGTIYASDQSWQCSSPNYKLIIYQ